MTINILDNPVWHALDGTASRARASAAAWRGTIRATWRRSRPSPSPALPPMPTSRPICRRAPRRGCFGRRSSLCRMVGRRSSAFRMLQMVASRAPAVGGDLRRSSPCRQPTLPRCWIWSPRPNRDRSAGARRCSAAISASATRPSGRHGRRTSAPAGSCRAQRHLRPSRSAGKGLCRRADRSADAACLRRRRGAVPSCPAGERGGRRASIVAWASRRAASSSCYGVDRRRRRNRDAWRVVWTAFVVAMFGWGVGFSGPGVYLAALHRIHGWSISTISLAITAHFLVSAALISRLARRLSPFRRRPVTIAGAALAGAGAVAWTNAPQSLAARAGVAAERRGLGGDERRGAQRHRGALVRARPAEGDQHGVQWRQHRRPAVRAVVDDADRRRSACRRPARWWLSPRSPSSARWRGASCGARRPAALRRPRRRCRVVRCSANARFATMSIGLCARPVRPDRPVRASDREARTGLRLERSPPWRSASPRSAPCWAAA